MLNSLFGPISKMSFLVFTCLPLLLVSSSYSADSPTPPPPEVTVLQVTEQPANLTLDIVGEIKAYREVELRSRVSGNLIEISFEPGQNVKKGDLLFAIDPGPYEAALTTAQAELAQASASLSKARQDVERYKPLLPDNAIPRQVYEQTVAQVVQEEAVVVSRKANVERAELNLGYTKISSPLDGRIGLQEVEVGSLVTAGQSLLAKVSTLDPIAVYFSVSENEYLDYVERREKAGQSGMQNIEDSPVELTLPNDSIYPLKGRIDFSNPKMNSTTGTMTLRAIFDNPDNLLRDGMNCQVRFYYDRIEKAILVPQKSVTETLGRYFLTVLGAGNVIETRSVELGHRIGGKWLVKKGLKAGETIVVEGVQKVKTGTVVTPVPEDGVAN